MAKKLEVVITGDAKGLSNSFGEAESRAGRFQSKMAGISSKVGTAMKVGLGGAALGVATLGPQLVTLSGKLDAWSLKVSTVFEASSAAVRKWADANNEAFGVTDEELAGLAASFGDLLKPIGFTAQQAADMSMKVVGLSGALSEWSGGTRSAAEVSEILAKAMLGERDSLKELGISISEADVQARLATKGQKDLTGAALEQAKALATQELIFEKSTDAQKAYAAGGNATIRAGNKLKAIWGEVQVFLAQKLVPVLAKVAGWLADRLPSAAARVRDYFAPVTPVVDRMSDALRSLVERLRPVAEKIAEFVAKNPGPVFAALAVVIGGSLLAAVWSLAAAMTAAFAPVYLIAGAIALVAAGAVYAYQHFDTFRNAVDAAAAFIREKAIPALQAMWAWFSEKILPILKSIAEFYVTAYAAAFKVAINYVGWYVDKLRSLYDWFSVNVLPLLKVVAAWLVSTLGPAFNVISTQVQRNIDKLASLYNWFSAYVLPALKAVASWMNGTLSEALSNAGRGFSEIIGYARSLWDALSKVVDAAKSVASALSSLPGGGLVESAVGALTGGNAAGGHVSPVLGWRAVNESGQEFFRPNVAGTVVPVGPTRNAMASGGGGGVIVIPVHVGGREIDRIVVDSANRTTRATGRAPLIGTYNSLVQR